MRSRRIGPAAGLSRLYFKLESLNPTGGRLFSTAVELPPKPVLLPMKVRFHMTLAGRSLNLNSCRERQQRFAEVLQQRDADLAILTRPEHVYYFTGFRTHPLLQAIVAITSGGSTTLCAPNEAPESVAADEIVTYEAQWRCTLRQDQLAAALAVLKSAWPRRTHRGKLAVEGSNQALWLFGWIDHSGASVIDIDPDLWMLRRCKDADELDLIRRAIDCAEAMYRVASEIIVPGITEIEVYNQLHAEGVNAAGEPLTSFGNDFQCGSPGGLPRSRPIEAGELYILDLAPGYRGYCADMCRTICVGTHPTDEQRHAWEAIFDVLKMVEQTVRPGVSAAQLDRDAQQLLAAAIPKGCFHHLGHGFGLSPHEAPHLNAAWDDFFQSGDVFTAEPGLYAPSLKAGIRLEQNYLVTENGVERLTSFPLELVQRR
ncbi:M24 family metallopeptidase [Planctomicrobium piriforme]|uniref:M24 family metallopeptidase n=1 Tax=Planctomicrobium piriforme TaxID=1576369 RepID=UPI001FEA7BD8|nr:Xaa-Pro peptidase family protein [Planctomicrobium piriforme]